MKHKAVTLFYFLMFEGYKRVSNMLIGGKDEIGYENDFGFITSFIMTTTSLPFQISGKTSALAY